MFEPQLAMAITCSFISSLSAFVSCLFCLPILYQCFLGSPPIKLLALISLIQGLLETTPGQTLVTQSWTLCYMGLDTETVFFLFLTISRKRADLVSETGGPGQKGVFTCMYAEPLGSMPPICGARLEPADVWGTEE